MGRWSLFSLHIRPGSLFVQIQRSAAAPDSIPTAIFHWEHDCYPLAGWGRLCQRGGTDLRTAQLIGEEPVDEEREAA